MKLNLFLKIILSLFFILVLLFLMRLILPKAIDDVSPNMNCTSEELSRADIYYVVPKFNGIKISENQTWCQEILSMNKTLYLHGVTHEYKEFLTERDSEYLAEGVLIFKDCFGFAPEKFKPPQLSFNFKNYRVLRELDLKLDYSLNQLFHKTYHCGDNGYLKNSFIDLF